MTSVLGAKKRAEEFAAAVDGPASGSLRPELSELVGVVDALRTHAAEAATPRPEFSAALRERLLAEAAAVLPQDRVLALPPRRKGTRERRLALVATSLVMVGGTAGMAAAAQDALPGDPLYPVKRGMEQARVGLATSDTARGHDLLAQADSRLAEVESLLDDSRAVAQVPATIEDFTAQADEGSTILLEEFEESRDPAVIDDVRSFAAEGLATLQELARDAGASHQDDLTAAALALLDIDQRAAAACPTCADDRPALQLPQLFSSTAEATRALEAVERTSAGLSNDHPVMTTPGQGAGPGRTPAGDDGTATGTGEEEPGEGGGTGGGLLPDLPTGEVEAGGGSGGLGELGEQLEKSVQDSLDKTLKSATGGVLPEAADAVESLLP